MRSVIYGSQTTARYICRVNNLTKSVGALDLMWRFRTAKRQERQCLPRFIHEPTLGPSFLSFLGSCVGSARFGGWLMKYPCRFNRVTSPASYPKGENANPTNGTISVLLLRQQENILSTNILARGSLTHRSSPKIIGINGKDSRFFLYYKYLKR